jgi:chemotaxis receptor (MCP) glutamine deamidase CheD
LEGIPVVNEDLGGTQARKVIFFSNTARVMMKRQKSISLKALSR